MIASEQNNQVNSILLKPRFKISVAESQETVLKQFETKLNKNSEFDYKIITHHLVFDIKKESNQFWSPQLHIEVEEAPENTTLIRGLFGPKPQIWTFFMFLHFAVALTFFVFLVVGYSNYTLNKDFDFALTVCMAMLIIWVVFYLLGQIGKRKSRVEMIKMYDFLIAILDKEKQSE